MCGTDETEEVICPDCEGMKNFVSDCCAVHIWTDSDICSECHDHCGSEEIICEKCKGKGTIQTKL